MNSEDSQSGHHRQSATGWQWLEQPALTAETEKIAAGMDPGQFAGLFQHQLQQTLAEGFLAAGAHEGTLWLVDTASQNLVPAYNSGPHANDMVGRFRQPLNAGLVCMVFASEQPFLENEVWKNSQQSRLLDQKLQVQTWAMLAVPFYFLGCCRGVVSCVQLKRQPGEANPPGFRPEHLARVQRATSQLTQLVDLRLLQDVHDGNRRLT